MIYGPTFAPRKLHRSFCTFFEFAVELQVTIGQAAQQNIDPPVDRLTSGRLRVSNSANAQSPLPPTELQADAAFEASLRRFYQALVMPFESVLLGVSGRRLVVVPRALLRVVSPLRQGGETNWVRSEASASHKQT